MKKYTLVNFKNYDEKYEGKNYTYLTNTDLDYEVGDFVLVSAAGKEAIVRVSGFSDANMSGKDVSRKVIQVINMKVIEEQKESEAKLSIIKAELEKKMEVYNWEKRIENAIIDTDDNELFTLFEEYKRLKG